MDHCRRSLLVLLALVCMAAAHPIRAAEPGCAAAIEDFERITGTVQVSSTTESEVAAHVHAATQHCQEGRDQEARERLNDAWEALLGDSALNVPTPARLEGDPCTDGLRQVTELMTEPQVSEFAVDAADRLLEDARGLCEEHRPQEAQNKLNMAWSMLQDVP